MPKLAANLSLPLPQLDVTRLDRIGYRGWIGCEYNPKGDTLEGLTWAKLYR